MPRKNCLLVSAAALILLAAPALAQQHDQRDTGKAGFGRESAAAHGQPRPAPTPFPPGTHTGAPSSRAPQASRPQSPQAARHPMDGNRPSHSDNNRPGTPGFNRPDHSDNNRPGTPGFNRPGHSDNNRPGTPGFNRPGHSDNNRPGTPGFNRPGNPGVRPGGRPDYSSFRNYHQNFRSARRFRAPAYRSPPGWRYQRWTYGQVLPSLFWAQQYWLNDFVSYDLPPPPPGAVWVRYGNDAILIDRDSGEIITIEYDVFY